MGNFDFRFCEFYIKILRFSCESQNLLQFSQNLAQIFFNRTCDFAGRNA
ncbi:hypothetical protein [Helicobacter sp. 23-1045]